MSIITGFDNTDSALNIPKFYLGKITGQENIGARDSEGNPVPYYSSGDIGTLQSSVILQEFNKDEFKAPETAPNTDWINFLNPANPSDTTKTKRYSSFGFTKDVTWTIGLSDRDTEINYVTAVLSHWDDFIVKFGGIDYYFKDVYFVPVRQDLYIASDNFQTILKTPDDLFNALNNIKDSTSYLTIPVSNDARFFNEIVVDGEHNLYNFSNQLVAKNYLAAQDLYNNKSFFSFDAIYNVLESIRSKGDLMFGNGALRDLSVLNLFQQNTPYENITSGTIGNFNLITGLNLTGIKGFPTGYISGQYLQANETGLEFVPIDDPVFDFTGLTDTPSNITSVKFVRGNQAGDGLEFTGVKFLEDVDDRPSTPITSGYLQLTDQNTLVWNPVAPGGGDVTYNFTGSEYFTGLKDTPSGYELNKFLRSTHVGIEYADINDGLVSFTGLTDTPSSFTADKFLKINNAANAVEYVDIPSPSVDFTGLNDTPASYVNSSGKYLRINNAENSVEFIDISGEISSQEISWNSYLRRGDLPNASDHPGMFAYVSIDELGGNSGSAYIAHGNDWVQIFPTVPNFSFSGLVDTPASYIGSSGKFVKVSDDESGVEYANLPDPIVDFTGLTDTPSSFAGQSGKYLQVNAAENSLEFVNPLFSTGSFVGFGGATVLIGLETAQPQQGWNDRQITQLQGHSGIKNLSLSNNEITLPAGKYLINAEGGVFRSKQTRIGIEFTAGDYAGQRFESRSNYAGSIVGNDQGGARGSVKTAVQSQNQMTFKVVSFVGESQSATTFDYAQTDVTVLDLGGDRDVLSITGLFDTPTSYVGGSGKFLQVNDVEDGVQYSSLSGQISSQEIDWIVYSTISDLPSASEHHGMFAHVHSEGAAYMAHAGNWEKIYPVNASSLTFTGLSDTPNVYDNGKILQSTANGLEWVDMPAGGGGGGGSSSGGGAAENNSYLKSFVETFTGKLPDAIIVSDDNPRIYDLRSVITTQNPHIIQYFNGQETSNSNKQFSFNDDDSGSLHAGLTITNHTLHPDDSNLQDIINNGRALYFGGGGSSGGVDSVDDITDLPDNPADGQLITVGCDLYIGCNGEWVKVGADVVAPPSEAPACVSNLEEYNQYTEYKDQFLADNSNASFSAGLNNQTNIHDFIHDVCLFADSNLSQERNTVVIDETTYKWGMFAGDQNINIRAQAFSDSNVGSCTFKEWRSNLPNFPKTNAQETIFIDQDASITGYFECTVAPSQPNCNQVALHLQPDTGETIADKSDNQHTVTTVGDTVVDNTATLFGGGTMNFDGVGDAVKFVNINLTSISSSDFTIEAWFRTTDNTRSSTNTPGGKSPRLFTDGNTNADTGISLLMELDRLYLDLSTDSINGGISSNNRWELENISIQNNSWYHIAFVRLSNKLHIYIDGSMVTLGGIGGNSSAGSNNQHIDIIGKLFNSSYFCVGAIDETGGGWKGQIQDFRISKKVVYTNNFTPPTNLLTNLCPDQPNCNQVALHLQPDTGETIADKSDNQHAVTTVGDIVVDTTAMLFGGGTMNFDVNSELTISSISNDFMSDTKDFTIEMWVQFKSGIVDLLVHQHPTRNRSYAILKYRGDRTETIDGYGGANRWFQFLVNHGQGSTSASNVWLVFMNFESPVEIQVDTWYHLALVRSNTSTWNLYVNGQPCRISPRWADGGTYGDTAGSIIEYDGSMGLLANVNSSLAGHMQDIRISKKAVYTNNFTPPTNLLSNPCGLPGDQPSCSEVDFHLQASSGGTVEDKSANNRTITNPNNVTNQSFISNSETLFGESTLFFSTSRLLHFYPANFGSNDFTVEFWLKYDSPITTSTKDIIVTKGRDPTSTIELSIVLNQDKLRIVNNLIVEHTNTGIASILSNWTHIAAVRSGNSMYLYVNGQREIDVAINGSVYASPYETEIGNKSAAGGWTNNLKHMQDFRISTKAVYTSNFTPPTTLLPTPC